MEHGEAAGEEDRGGDERGRGGGEYSRVDAVQGVQEGL